MIFNLTNAITAARKVDLFVELIDGAPLNIYVRGIFQEVHRNGRPGPLVFINQNWKTVTRIISGGFEINLDGAPVRVKVIEPYELRLSCEH